MSDIFISYASADRDRARLLADALSQKGWLVWWDRTIPPGKEFDQVIEEALDGAKCVVVLWSKTSTVSSWVKTEAAEAMRRKILVPALIDETKIPLEFRRLQAADLSQWQGESSHPELEKFFQSIEANLSAMVEAVPEVKSTHPPLPIRPQPVEPARPLYINREQQATKSNTKWILGGIGIVAIVALLAGYFFYREHAQRVALEQRIAREKQEQAERERIAKEEAAREAASRKAEEDRRAAAERAAQQKAVQEQPARAARTRAAQQPAERVTPPGAYPGR
jgi:hypothetical protein